MVGRGRALLTWRCRFRERGRATFGAAIGRGAEVVAAGTAEAEAARGSTTIRAEDPDCRRNRQERSQGPVREIKRIPHEVDGWVAVVIAPCKPQRPCDGTIGRTTVEIESRPEPESWHIVIAASEREDTRVRREKPSRPRAGRVHVVVGENVIPPIAARPQRECREAEN